MSGVLEMNKETGMAVGRGPGRMSGSVIRGAIVRMHMLEGASYGATVRLMGRRGTFTVKEMGAAAGRKAGPDFKTLLTVT